ncbi:hypothetical protein Ocin01_02673 [Orchesella cincta]|uniref:Uncharacterized protein n=1 Tax=Orchesella cincta TaxID=48709 RepID=A0A1D2NGC9_ORCCI|nr:hypothetical protein Ocin01_02673 [Orchesella cincta]
MPLFNFRMSRLVLDTPYKPVDHRRNLRLAAILVTLYVLLSGFFFLDINRVGRFDFRRKILRSLPVPFECDTLKLFV